MTGEAQYLLTLYSAERERSPPISPGYIAGELGRSPAATTEMLQRLDERGVVTYEPYEGATLTEEGRARASDIFESYQTLTQFFEEVLELEEYEREARQLAGTVSPDVADRLAATLLSEEDASTDRPQVPSQSDHS